MCRLLVALCVMVALGAVLFFVGTNERTELSQKADPRDTAGIIIGSPQQNMTLSNPATISGKARGFWFFEGSFPVELVLPDGTVVAGVVAQAQGDWMTEEYVDFEAILAYPVSATGEATLVFRKDNPSGLPENDRSVVVPVMLPGGDAQE